MTDRNHWWQGQGALFGTAVSLLGTTAVTSLLGLAFWGLAAHLMPVAAVGYGSAAVSALTLVGTFGMAGLNTALIGPLARERRDPGGLLSASLCASALISAALAAGFIGVAAVFAPHLAPYLRGGAAAAGFIAGSALTGAGFVLDEALLGVLGGGLQFWRNTAFAMAKLAALAGLAAIWHDRFGGSVLAAWIAGTAVSAVPAALVLRRQGIRLVATPRWRALQRLGRASAGNIWLNNALQGPRLAVPLVVTALLSPAHSGAFYVAWTIVTLTSLLPNHFATALYAAGAATARGLAGKLRFTLRTCMLSGLAGVPLVVLCAHPLLRLFGAAYAAGGTVPLELLTLGYFGSVIANHYIALCRISRQLTRGAIFATASAAARLAAVAAGAATGGLTGLSLALLAVMCAEGLYAAPAVRRGLRERQQATAATAAPVAEPAVPERETRPGAVRVCYHLQTHGRAAQVGRLVEVIKEGSPASLVLISHDAAAPALDIGPLAALPGVHVFSQPGGYGDFSHLDRYFAAVDWLDAQRIGFDWMVNLSGQDYPLRPVAEIERALAASDVDGYLEHAPVFSGQPGLCSPFDASMRYHYRHWRFGRPTRARQRWLRPLMAVDWLQPWVRLSLAYSSVGVRRRTTVFTDGFTCYGGSFFGALSARCVRYARDFARANPDLVGFFRTVLAPEEVFLQTVLVNSGKFRLDPDAKRYLDWNGSRNNHPKTLGVADLPAMLASGAHFARKFDPGRDPEVLDLLDLAIRQRDTVSAGTP
jgi:O-antigen/teichoic acid export membrane protein